MGDGLGGEWRQEASFFIYEAAACEAAVVSHFSILPETLRFGSYHQQPLHAGCFGFYVPRPICPSSKGPHWQRLTASAIFWQWQFSRLIEIVQRFSKSMAGGGMTCIGITGRTYPEPLLFLKSACL
jgi:hypothetical protein